MRISSETERQNTNLQRDALLKAGVKASNLFEDRASGAKTQRVGLQDALSILKSGDCLVVWKLDRLGRSLQHLLAIITGLKKNNISFRSLTEQMDTTTPHGELLFNLFGSLAQYERALTRERIMAGLEAAKRRGRIGGRPRLITAPVIDEIKMRLKKKESNKSIQRTMGISHSTFYYIMKNYLD